MPPDRPTLQPTIGWDAKLAVVAGRHATTIEKAFGYRTVGELLQHYPRRWVERDKLSEPDTLEVDDFVTVLARVASVEAKPYRDRRTGKTAHRLEVSLETGGDPGLEITRADLERYLGAMWDPAIRVSTTRASIFT